jgi:DNA-binding beta-propeller fold protein YncE
VRAALVLLLVGACRASPADGLARIPLPNGDPGIGFDDLRFSSALGRIIAPAGRSGRVDLIDPATHAITSIDQFAEGISYFGGHDFGATSADAGGGIVLVTDRTTMRIYALDPATQRMSFASVASSPDYVRYVAATNEAWVTEPDDERIEVFSIGADPQHTLSHAAFIAAAGGPESLVIDGTRGRAYTHLWGGATYAIDVHTRGIVGQWANGCAASRGIAVDEARGFVFAGCNEGKAVVLDAAHDGAQLSFLSAGTGVDVIDYSSTLHHLYLPGADSSNMAILGVSATGQLSLLGTRATVAGGHCVAADDRGNAYVCDPDNGELLVVPDSFPASGP